MKKEITNFITNNAGISRYNLTNKLWHLRNITAALILFGFSKRDETLTHVITFFKNFELSCPKIKIENRELKIQPACLIELEQILIANFFMQSFPHRLKYSLILNISRQSVSICIEKWLTLWATFGSYI